MKVHLYCRPRCTSADDFLSNRVGLRLRVWRSFFSLSLIGPDGVAAWTLVAGWGTRWFPGWGLGEGERGPGWLHVFGTIICFSLFFFTPSVIPFCFPKTSVKFCDPPLGHSSAEKLGKEDTVPSPGGKAVGGKAKRQLAAGGVGVRAQASQGKKGQQGDWWK